MDCTIHKAGILVSVLMMVEWFPISRLLDKFGWKSITEKFGISAMTVAQMIDLESLITFLHFIQRDTISLSV